MAAFDSATGKLIWQTPLAGRVHGLAIANGALYASTDQGGVYCFRPTAAKPFAALGQADGEPTGESIAIKPISSLSDKTVVSRWVLQEEA